MPESVATRRGIPPPVVTLRPGETLFNAGDRPEALFVVQEGRLELLSPAAGDRPGSLAVIEAGEVVGGECGLADQEPAPFTARALVETTVVRVDAAVLPELVRLRPEVASSIIGSLSRSLGRARMAALAAARETEAADAKGSRDPSATVFAMPPRLLHTDSAAVFMLPAEGDALVGRTDARAKFVPDIDLSGLDNGRSLSRRHAVIRRTGDLFVLVEEPRVANGTFVNGERVKPSVPTPIRDGDEVRFGLVPLRFRAGSPASKT